jgi:hypothetical protein
MDRAADTHIMLKLTSVQTLTTTDGAVVASNTTDKVIIRQIDIPDGVGAGHASRAWSSARRFLASGASETLDFYQFTGIDIGAGVGNDAIGLPLLLENIMSLIVTLDEGPGRLEITPGAANPANFVGSLTVANGGALNEGGTRVYHEPGMDVLDLSATKRNVNSRRSAGICTIRFTLPAGMTTKIHRAARAACRLRAAPAR